jgi:hypothetical protein
MRQQVGNKTFFIKRYGDVRIRENHNYQEGDGRG